MRTLNVKYIVAILLISIFAVEIYPVKSAFAADDAIGDKNINEEYLALKQMGFIGDDISETDIDEQISRAQFVGILFKMAGYEKMEFTGLTSPFIDVNSTTLYKDEIYSLYNMGFINGAEENLFLPDRGIKYFEAVKISLDVLGYKDFITVQKGSFPANYENVARSLKLLSNINYSAQNIMTIRECTKFLYKLGMTGVMTFSGAGGQNATYANDKETLLSRYQDIHYGEGIMQSNGIASIISKDVNYENAVINNEIYKCNELDLFDLLGENVKFFFKEEDGTNKLLWVAKKNTSQSIKIKYADLMIDNPEYGLSKIIYEQNDRVKSAKIDDFASFIYNNSLCNSCTVAQLKPKSGNIKLVDNNQDSKYDIVIISEYKDIFINSVSTIGNFISGKNGATINLDNYDYYRIVKDGRFLTLDECPTNIVASYIENTDNKSIFIYINDVGVTDTLNTISETLTFSEGEYRLSDNLKSMIDGGLTTIQLQVGSKYTIYFNADGDIGEMSSGVSNQIMYAYIISAKQNRKRDAIENSALLKVVVQTGETVEASTAKKIIIDGASGMTGMDLLSDARLFSGGTLIEQVVILRFNGSGEIKEIDFADDLPSAAVYPYDSKKFTRDYYTTNGFYNKDECDMINYKYYVGQNTICFVKYINADVANQCRVVKRNEITERRDYTISVYDCDSTMQAAAISIEIDASKTFESSHVLVDKVAYVWDDEEVHLQISGYSKGKAVVYKEVSQDAVTHDVKKGDILRVSLVDGKMAKIDRICRLSDKPSPFIYLKNSSAQPGGDEFTQIFGYLYSKGENTIVTVNPDDSPFGKLSTTSFKNSFTIPIMVYNNKEKTVYTGTMNDLYQTSAPNASGSLTIRPDSVMVFLYRRYNYAQEIIVVYY